MADKNELAANAGRSGLGLIGIITAILFALKIAGVAQISWLLVFTPLLAWWGLILGLLLLFLIVAGIVALATKD